MKYFEGTLFIPYRKESNDKEKLSQRYQEERNKNLRLIDDLIETLKFIEDNKKVPFKLVGNPNYNQKNYVDIWNETIVSPNSSMFLELFFLEYLYMFLHEFVSYVYVAIEESNNNNFGVAYSLLRKPYFDLLSYIEWLYLEPSELINSIVNGNKDGHDFEKVKKDLSNRIVELSKSTDVRESREHLYEKRFINSSRFSIKNYCDRSHHIMTNFTHWRTDGGEFNLFQKNIGNNKHYNEFFINSTYALLYYTCDIIDNALNEHIKSNRLNGFKCNHETWEEKKKKNNEYYLHKNDFRKF